MPRAPRAAAESGHYHVVAKGVNNGPIFADQLDRDSFVERLGSQLDRTGFSCLAFALMTNHFHLLVDCSDEDPAQMLQPLVGSYATEFNRRHGRSGHLFKERHFRAAIESEGYLLECIRYIHQNPLMAGVFSSLSCPWTSYDLILDGRGPVDAERAIGIFGSREEFVRFHQRFAGKHDRVLARSERGLVTDDEAAALVRAQVSCDPFEIAQWEPEDRDACVRQLVRAGIQNKQIQRLTGLSKDAVYRAAA